MSGNDRDLKFRLLVKKEERNRGVAPFDDLKPVKKFTSRKAAIGRIWQAVQRLVANQPAKAAARTKAHTKSPPAKKKRAAKAPAGERDNKKAQVIALMGR